MLYSQTNGERRFGFGLRWVEDAAVDSRVWLKLQLDASDNLVDERLPNVANAIYLERHYEQASKAGANPSYGLADLFGEEMEAALKQAVATPFPFRERLVWFWANHFTVSGRAGNYVFGFAGAYLKEAIRPHVTGRFVDMLKAVMVHPCMLWYLDNRLSEGTDSPKGRKDHAGINENLARECLELHTLGVDAGYTQHDVTAFAAVLTGRTINFDGDDPGYVFRPDMHEPGPKTVLGRTFPEGFKGSQEAIEFIGTHASTYRHIATKLVRHFTSDTPPPHCIEAVVNVLTATDGDLKAATLAVIDMPEAWQMLTKFRAPAEYVVAVTRALGLPPEQGNRLLAATGDLGQPFMGALLPNGWPDTAGDWITGEALLKRADWALTQAQRPGAPNAMAVLEATLGDLCSDTTRAAVRRCPNNAEALATVFASPEFMRR